MENFSAPDWEKWEPQVVATLCFVFDAAGRVLLIRKKRGLGAGKINAPGGKLDAGETPAECAAREVVEELGIVIGAAREMGVLHFQFTPNSNNGLKLKCHVFVSEEFTGEPVETDEAIPFWFAPEAIPYEEMWRDDAEWLPKLLRGEKFTGWFVFDDDAMLFCKIED